MIQWLMGEWTSPPLRDNLYGTVTLVMIGLIVATINKFS